MLPSPRWPKLTTPSLFARPICRLRVTSSATRSRGTTTSSFTLPICTFATAALTDLRSFHSRAASSALVAWSTVRAPACTSAARTASPCAFTSPAPPLHLDDEQRAGAGRHLARARRGDGVEGGAVEELECGRDDAGLGDRRHRGRRRLHVVECAGQGGPSNRRGDQPEHHLGDDCQCAF